MSSPYPKRLIEVDLPIKRISAHARREKSIRHGHISTLHIWWARRPLAACRAVICAALWPDPADEHCPVEFREGAAKLITAFAKKAVTTKDLGEHCSSENWQKWQVLAKPESAIDIENAAHLNILRYRLLDFIADFANWDNSTQKDYLETSRTLTQLAHEALGGVPGTRPLVVDPFAGGGAIPLEALRVGADAFASDLNPVAVLLNKVVLEYIPKYGQKLADEVRKWGQWVKEEAEKELAEFYPKDADGSTPIAYLWARTIQCEGPGCGVDLPLIGQTWLSTKNDRKWAFTLAKNPEKNSFDVVVTRASKTGDVMPAISKKSSATCPLCGYTTSAKRVRDSLAKKSGGSDSAKLLAVITKHPSRSGKNYRMPHQNDLDALNTVATRFTEIENQTLNGLPSIPHEAAPPEGALGFRFQKYGIRYWRDLYTSRQLLALVTLARIITGDLLQKHLDASGISDNEKNAVLTCLSLGIGRVNDLSSTLCRWLPSLEAVAASNGGQNKMPMILDFVEVNPIGGAGGDWEGQIDWIVRVIRNLAQSNLEIGQVICSPAQQSYLPNDIASAIVTDPPYYDAFGYSDLSEFFYPWLRRSVPPSVFNYCENHVPKEDEAVSINKHLEDGRGDKNDETYLESMKSSFSVSRYVVQPGGVGVVVFANKTTAGWEAILEALIEAKWTVTASWPIDTERPNRQRAIRSAALQSSIHLVCRPRENPDGTLKQLIGDWRDVLQELPQRIHEWMPRLAAEGVVGADAIFACLGPALEVFSRYSTVEKASGELVTLREYLEYVWAAVSKEALSMIFADADATGLEEDARLTAMWLWTLSTGSQSETDTTPPDDEEPEDDDDEEQTTSSKAGGFTLEFDTARKIAQGLGANLETLKSIVEIKGNKARLLPVQERLRYLMGKGEELAPAKRKKKGDVQLSLPGILPEVEDKESVEGAIQADTIGKTALDRIHQSMLLFASGRSEALKRFLVDDGVGQEDRFWKLAQSLSALYPPHTDEKRWVDGVLARKKGLGF